MVAVVRCLRDQFFLSLSVVCALLLVARLAYVYLANPEHYPINTVKIVAHYQHITREKLEKTLEKYAHEGFFSLSIGRLKADLLALPWTQQVQIERVWPDTLKIRLEEKKPIAIWNHLMMTPDGQLFDLSDTEWQKESILDHLPHLSGPHNQQIDVLQMFQKLSKLTAAYGLSVQSLVLQDNQSWELGLTNGVILRLGKEKINRRLERFCQAYPVVFADKFDELAAVDLRYAHGMAAQWKKSKQ